MSIQFFNLNCRLRGKEILKNISGEIFSGKLTAILGPNGCGKSTWLRALLSLVTLEAGSITGIPSGVGYLPQKKEIYWPLTCEAIVRLGNHEPRHGGQAGTKNQEKIISRLGIKYLCDKRIDEISGGERTLVLLARALRDQPALIVADEPVSELDPKYQVEVMRILKEEAARGAIVLVTMHDIQLTQRFCDDVFLMRDGENFQSGEVQKTLTTELLNELFKVSFQKKIGFYAQ